MAPTVDYTARDFDTIMIALRNRLQSKFPNDWRNFSESGIGTAYLEIGAYIFDCLSYQSDVKANEVYVPTLRFRESIVRIGKGLGYRLRGPTGAGVTVSASIKGGPYGVDIIVPAGTVMTTIGNVHFITLADQRIAAGSTTGSVVFSQGEIRSETFSAPGTAWYSQKLLASNIIEGSLAVTIDGTVWDEVESLIFSDDASREFQWERDADGYVTVIFGDGTSGMLPSASASIVISYRVGGGVIGNINTDQVQETIEGYLDGTSPPILVQLDLTNQTQRGSGGEEPESIAHAKMWLPAFVAANSRAVTERDFDVLASRFYDATYGRVALAKAKLKQEIPELNTVELRVWSRDYSGQITVPSSGLKTALYNYFMNNSAGAIRLICTDVEVLDGDIVYLDLDVTATLSADYAASDVVSGITTALDGLLTGDAQLPGEAFRISLVYDRIQDSTGVSHALINQVTASMSSREAIGLGDAATTHFVAVLDLEPGLPIVAGTVEVEVGTAVLSDQGDGTLLGDGTGTIDYETGDLVLDFTSAPASGAIVYATYRHVIDYQRGDEEQTCDGISRRFRGSILYPPIVPYDAVTGLKGIAFSDGTQVAIDDGGGNLIGADVDPAGINRIDYDTGSFDLTFNSVPPAGAKIRSTYKQKLQTSSEDIPITKTQVAVKGTYTITTEQSDL